MVVGEGGAEGDFGDVEGGFVGEGAGWRDRVGGRGVCFCCCWRFEALRIVVTMGVGFLIGDFGCVVLFPGWDGVCGARIGDFFVFDWGEGIVLLCCGFVFVVVPFLGAGMVAVTEGDDGGHGWD